MILLWIATALCAVGGGFMLLESITTPEISAPQQGALAAVAVGLAAIPYVFARACQEMVGGLKRTLPTK